MSTSLLVLCDTAGHEGGTETYLERVLPELASSGITLTVAARRILVDRAFGLPVRSIEWSNEHEAPSHAAAVEVKRLIDELAPDAVMTSNVFDEEVLAAARTARRFIVRLHDHRAFCPNGDRRFPQLPGNCTSAMGAACALNAMVHGCVAGLHGKTFATLRARMRVRDAIQRADAVVVCSEFMARSCISNGIEERRIVVAPPPLARESFTTRPVSRPHESRLLFAGRILPQKGLVSLVRALGHIIRERRPILSVAGDDTPELTRAREIAEKNGVRLELLGWLTQPQMRDAIDASDAVAVPSLWPEPFGLVGIEAQARGRPAVAYAAGGIPEWIAGIAVPIGNERALAGAIEEITAAANWDRYAAAALRRAVDFHPEHHIGMLRTLISSSF
jgi:glycosyltransferase involved in cell wall biosynthesis